MRIDVQSISKSFGEFEALRDVTLDVPAGSLTAHSGSMMVEIASIVEGNALPITNAQARPATTAR